MEDDVGPVGGNDDTSLSADLPSETLLQNMCSENQVEEDYEDGEIMVEVVGSDVLVDGVSGGQKEGDVVPGEVEHLEGPVWESREENRAQDLPEATSAYGDEDETKVVTSESELSASRSEQNCAVSEKLEVEVRESVDVDGGAVNELLSQEFVVANDEAWNPGIEAMAVSSSAMLESVSGRTEEVLEKSSVVEVDESAIKDEAIDNNGGRDNKATHLLSDPVEVFVVEEVCISDKKEKLQTIDSATSQDCLIADSLVSCETKSAEEGGEVTALVDPNGGGSETAHFDRVDVVEETNAESGHGVGPLVGPYGEDVKTACVNGIDVIAQEAGSANSDANLPVGPNHSDLTPSVPVSCSVPASEIATPTFDGGEILTTGSSEVGVSGAIAESVSADGVRGIDAKVADEKATLDAERKDLIPAQDDLQSHMQDENQGSKEILGIEPEATHKNDSSSHEQSFVGEREKVMCMDHEGITDVKDGTSQVNNLPCASDELLKNEEDLQTDMVLQNHVSSGEQTQPANSVDTYTLTEEVMGMELDGVTDFKDGMPQANNLPSASNDETLKTKEDSDTDMVLQNHVSSGEQTQLVDIGDTSALSEDHDLGVENQAGVEQNLAHTMNPKSPEDNEIVKADSAKHTDQPIVGTAVDKVTNEQNIVISQVKVADEDRSSEGGRGDVETVAQFIECHETAKSPALDTSTENMLLSENCASSEAETVEVVVADLVVSNAPVVTVEAELNTLMEECGSPKSATVEVSVPKTDTPNDGASELEIPNNFIATAAVSDNNHADSLQEMTTEFHVSDSNILLLDGGDIQDTLMIDVASLDGEITEFGEAEDNASNGNHIVEDHMSEAKVMEVMESEYDQKYQEGDEVECRDPELGTEEPVSDTDKLMVSTDEPVKSSSSLYMNQSGYLPPPGDDGKFAVSDLVWGKVRSHPWWPGQIFDPADASDKAVKYHKKDSYLVAYFGDRTFAWNDATLLKPFKMHFSQIEKQSTSEAFQNAVSCALDEVSRRVELGLACSCTPKDAYGKIETQVVENTGIREESSQRYGVDQSTGATSFEPDKLLEYVRDLAPRASYGADRLDVAIAQAQLSAFCCYKGYRPLTDYPVAGELLENDADTEEIGDETVGSHKNKHTPKDSLQSQEKETSLTDLKGDEAYSPDGDDESIAKDPNKSVSSLSGNKRKALDPLTDGSDKRVSVHAAKVSASTIQTPKPSFKIGECIRRVASQLTGSTTMAADGSQKINDLSDKKSMVVPAESSSVNEMLLQLQLVAQEPKKGHNFPNSIISFFVGFRSSVAVNKRGRKKKSDKAIGGSAEDFEFDDVNDSYWTDRIVQNYSEKQLMENTENGAGNLQVVPFDSERSVRPGRKSRKRFFSGNYPTAPSEIDEKVKRRKQETSPAELILNFAERARVPSEINLNKMFRRFGPLMESETEVDHDSARARVIFKRGSDAEVAHSSAQKFSIFGPVLVNYEIGYSPLISVKISPLALPQGEEDASVMM